MVKENGITERLEADVLLHTIVNHTVTVKPEDNPNIAVRGVLKVRGSGFEVMAESARPRSRAKFRAGEVVEMKWYGDVGSVVITIRHKPTEWEE